MSGFSEDGQNWWDGARWIATSQVLIPDMPIDSTDPREHMRRYRLIGKGIVVDGLLDTVGLQSGLGLVLMFPFLFLQRRVFGEYRQWMLEQLAQVTTYLLGDAEPMIAGEVSTYPSFLFGVINGGIALVVTANHVLVVSIDPTADRPRSVILVARPRDVRIEARGSGLFTYPRLLVHHGPGAWAIQGTWRLFRPEPVLAAWHQAMSQVSQESTA
jgi:hypothetical protein